MSTCEGETIHPPPQSQQAINTRSIQNATCPVTTAPPLWPFAAPAPACNWTCTCIGAGVGTVTLTPGATCSSLTPPACPLPIFPGNVFLSPAPSSPESASPKLTPVPVLRLAALLFVAPPRFPWCCCCACFGDDTKGASCLVTSLSSPGCPGRGTTCTSPCCSPVLPARPSSSRWYRTSCFAWRSVTRRSDALSRSRASHRARRKCTSSFIWNR
ncbi:hypothetical protein M427DRAFT_407518 [Gonapodya prolifera JEL478]|uniref:Uncharacterized protein n=1 Tax=Gonapodya prolifera (strain JEL478) TaxID=1344416 RepID=A0A139AUB6_GONPJ|nr:hypothetical protein M427DRAFT_407518 [Gonapodya prolifera JEL478]|eukprot:KXS20330.1 hypothetical protein M427DRAFT_407518 [Gonapodya prolifera JEL478]